MAVFTGAVLAVSAAIATTTFATVATAAVAVSAAVGVAGLAVTAVGLITKNEDLLKAGKIMGYVGLAGGLAGGLIGGIGGAMSGTGSFMQGAADAYAGASQFLKEGWDSGVGQLFSSSTGAEVAGGVQGVPNGINPTAPTTATTTATPTATPTGSLYPGGGQEVLGKEAVQATQANMGAMQANAGIAPSPSIPTASGVGTPGVITPGVTPNPIPGYAGPGAAAIPGATPAATPGFLGSMPEWSKYAMMTTAGQGVSGLASGYFTGLSAEEKLAQEKRVNQQAQDQLQLLNRQGSYAPLIRFRGPGLAQSGGR